MRLVYAILLGGFAAGAFDITYAFVAYGPLSYGVDPLRVLQSVASGWIGRDAARAGGLGAAALGLVTHFAIATAMAAVFVLAAQRARALTQRPIAAGLVYGLILYGAMNYLVVPLSAAGANEHMAASLGEAGARLAEAFRALRPTIDPAHAWLFAGAIFAHTVLVGLPIALTARRFTV